jgi:cytoskeleton protein RodZ
MQVGAMSDEHDVTHETMASLSAGATLRAAREAHGMSIDAVAQQLKLAPRQVQALEDDDYAQLPGRTFVRGFMRNYARLLRLDADAVIASLPDAGHAPSLDRPSLSPTTRVMGELPADLPAKPSSARWAIVLALIAIVIIAVAYEFGRPLAERGRAALSGRSAAPAATPVAPEPPPGTSTPVPVGETPAPAAQAASATSDPAPAAQAAPAGDAPLVFVFRGTSWIEVKDATGAVVLSTMGYPGATHAVNGTFPLDVVLGNAEAVIVSLRGAQFDTTPYVKQNVAKFTVK